METVADVSNVSSGRIISPLSILGTVWGSYFFRKFLRALAAIFTVTTISFFLGRLLPGNAIVIYVNQLVVTYGMAVHEAKYQAAALFAIDLEQPVTLQCFSYLRKLAQGNSGQSVLSPDTTVTEVILRFPPWTLFSVGLGHLISFMVGVLIGVIMAYNELLPQIPLWKSYGDNTVRSRFASGWSAGGRPDLRQQPVCRLLGSDPESDWTTWPGGICETAQLAAP